MDTTTHSRAPALIRPAWTPATIALTVVGFAAWWPLGFAMLAYILWGDRLDGFKRDVNDTTDEVFRGLRAFSPRGGYRGRRARHGYGLTGNLAFDEWRVAELKRLDEERRKLETMRGEFESYARELRRAKDKDEFDRFMRERDATLEGTRAGFDGREGFEGLGRTA